MAHSKSIEALMRRAARLKALDGRRVRLRVVGRDYTPMKLSNRRSWRPFTALRVSPEDLGLNAEQARQLTSHWR